MRVPSERENQREKRRAFEQMASELGFTLHHTSFDVGEHTDIGLFAGPLASPVMDFDPEPSVAASGGDLSKGADKKIKKCVRGWESLAPKKYASSYTDFANESYLLICGEGIGHVDGSTGIEGNDAFAQTLACYPVYKPRKVKVKGFQITHIGGNRAVATYTVSEKFTNGTKFTGNAVAVLAKLEQGWRIIIATDHLHTS